LINRRIEAYNVAAGVFPAGEAQRPFAAIASIISEPADTGGSYLIRTNFIRRDWTGLLLTAGVPYRKFRALRHTHASRWLAAEVAKRIETVRRDYAHWFADTNRDTAAKVEAMYGTPRGDQ
jgi:integrase